MIGELIDRNPGPLPGSIVAHLSTRPSISNPTIPEVAA